MGASDFLAECEGESLGSSDAQAQATWVDLAALENKGLKAGQINARPESRWI